MIPAAWACQCETAYGTRREVAGSDAVFIGKVQSIDPIYLNLWNLAKSASVQSVSEAYTDAQQHPSPAALTRLKDTYLKAFPDLAADTRKGIEDAKTPNEVTSLFYSELRRGMRVHFQVKTLFKQDDDDDKKGDDDDLPESLDVWTPFGDCGFDFQIGETYLVYASKDDEESQVLSTGSCTRTRRLSDAGDDLAYLYFYKDHAEGSRLEGFATTDELYQTRVDQAHDPETVKAPVAGAVVELKSSGLTRYAESDSRGRFVFDGLSAGDYRISAFARGYPLQPQLLSRPAAAAHRKEELCAPILVAACAHRTIALKSSL